MALTQIKIVTVTSLGVKMQLPFLDQTDLQIHADLKKIDPKFELHEIVDICPHVKGVRTNFIKSL